MVKANGKHQQHADFFCCLKGVTWTLISYILKMRTDVQRLQIIVTKNTRKISPVHLQALAEKQNRKIRKVLRKNNPNF